MVTKSSINRKPFPNLTNIVRKPYHSSSFSQLNKPGSSNASDSSIGSTQNPIHVNRPIIDQPLPSTHQKFTTDHRVGDENHKAYAQRQITQKTTSKTNTGLPFNQTSFQETRKGSVPLCSSTLDKIKNQGKVNQSCLNKTTNDGKKISIVPHNSSMENIKDKRNTIEVPFSAPHMKNTKNSMDTPIIFSTVKMKHKGKENENNNIAITMPHDLMKRKDKGKAIAVPLDYPSMKNLKSNMVEVRVPLSGVKIKDRGETVTGSNHVDLAQKFIGKENENNNITITMPHDLMKRKDKGKAIAVPLDYPSIKNSKSNMMEVRVPLSGVKIKDRGETITGSSCVAQKDKGKENENNNMAITMPCDLMNKPDKGKAIAVPLDYPSMKNVKSNMMEVLVPLSGVNIKDRGETVTGSSRVDLAHKDKGKSVTPINYHTEEKKNKRSSCPPLSRTTSHRNGVVDIIQSKAQTDPPPNKKKRRYSSNKVEEEFALPPEFVEQQNAYFKEIDDFELQVEEV